MAAAKDTAASAPMLEVRGLRKTFNPEGNLAHVALDGIDLNLEAGEFACIVGSNGAGKTTLFNAIAGTVIPDEGLVRIDGENVTFEPDYKRARTLSRVFQDPLKGTAPNLTVAENVSLAYGRATRGGALKMAMRREKREFIRERLHSLGFGLEDRMDAKVGHLSGGQRQAVTLLMATIGHPNLLLLDEHTAALDPRATETVLRLTDRIVAEDGIATLMITHDLACALAHGTRTLVMHEGRIVADVRGPEREAMEVGDLLELFRTETGKAATDEKLLLQG